MNGTAIDLVSRIAAANEGPVLAGQLIPLNNIGPLRVTYNWLYSALNCDPTDTSSFPWVLSNVGSGPSVSLSPQQPFSGMTLYASVRDDYDYTVQVQAPFSADWITAVGGDETLALTKQGFFTVSLTGMNGQYLCADGSQTQHDDHSGFLFHSAAGSIGPSSSFFVLVNQLFQDVGIPLASQLDPGEIAAALSAQGASDPQALAATIQSLTSPA